ncbi:MAG: hypothetical protein JJT89_02010 [Nitriliruptoraceae bacterium]|nr:hypothetical protein [Nitriliruptoraceae bacterium]
MNEGPGVADQRGPAACRVQGRALRLVVLGDSTAFVDGEGPQLPGHHTLWPSVLAGIIEQQQRVDVEVTVVARPGTTVGELERTLYKDRHVPFDVVAPADVVVVAVGSFDHAPAGVPAALSAVVPQLQHPGVRRRARRLVQQVYPVLTRVRGGYRTRTSWPAFASRYRAVLQQVRGLTWDRATYLAVGPTSHRSPYYGDGHPQHVLAEQAQLALARDHGFETLAAWPLVLPDVDALNADGIHWPAPVHRRVGEALAAITSARWA